MAGDPTYESKFKLVFERLPRLIIFYETWMEGAWDGYCLLYRYGNSYMCCNYPALGSMKVPEIVVNGTTVSGSIETHLGTLEYATVDYAD